MIIRKELLLAFSLLFVVVGCAGDSPEGGGSASTKSNAPREVQRLLPKEVAALTKSVQAAGGQTMLRPESKAVLVRFEGGSFGDEQLAELVQLEFATAFNARGGKITDAGLGQLASAGERIETLDLTGNPITDDGLAHLQQMDSLKFVILDKTNVTAAGVERLQQALPSLNIGYFQ